MVGLKAIKKCQKEMNNIFEIISTEFGYFVDPLQKITFVCKKFLNESQRRIKSEKTFKNFQGDAFKIKLSADSTNISRNKTALLNFTFNLLDEKVKACSVNKIFILGIIKFSNIKYCFCL